MTKKLYGLCVGVLLLSQYVGASEGRSYTDEAKDELDRSTRVIIRRGVQEGVQFGGKIGEKGIKELERFTRKLFGKDKKKINHDDIFAAAADGRDDAVSDLLDHGVDVNRRWEKCQATPLMVASRHGCIAVISLLIARKALVNLQEDHGKTAVYFAAEGGFSDAVRLLVRKGHADVAIRARNDLYPCEIARDSDLQSYLYELMPEAYKRIHRDEKHGREGGDDDEIPGKRQCH